MAPVLLLIVVFAMLAAVRGLTGRPSSWRACGRVALGAMFVFTGVSHFLFPEVMIRMVPPPVPLANYVVLGSGLFEIALGIALCFPRLRRACGIAAVLLLIALFPANVWAAMNRTGFGGHVEGPGYLWIRTAIQLLFIAWAWWSTARD